MLSSAKYISAFLCLASPAIAQAQSLGQVECPRTGGYVYLYSSMTTLDVRTTLQCGEQVQITGRYDLYFGIRTAKGDVGYVPVESLLLLKDQPGTKKPQPRIAQPARERTMYDAPAAPAEGTPSAALSPSGFTLRNGTPIRLRLGKTISSASAHVGDAVDLQAVEEIIVDGLSVVPKGAAATGIVTEVEPKKRLGHGGKLAFRIDFVRLRDNEKAAVRSYQESTSANSSAGAILPLATRKEVLFTQGAEFTAYIDGDMRLKKEAFQTEKDTSSAAPALPDHKAPQPH